MKKEYSVPEVEFLEFENDIITASSIHDGTEVECSCTAFNGFDFTKA